MFFIQQQQQQQQQQNKKKKKKKNKKNKNNKKKNNNKKSKNKNKKKKRTRTRTRMHRHIQTEIHRDRDSEQRQTDREQRQTETETETEAECKVESRVQKTERVRSGKQTCEREVQMAGSSDGGGDAERLIVVKQRGHTVGLLGPGRSREGRVLKLVFLQLLVVEHTHAVVEHTMLNLTWVEYRFMRTNMSISTTSPKSIGCFPALAVSWGYTCINREGGRRRERQEERK